MTVPVEAWPVPSVTQAPLKYRVKSDEKPMLYTAALSADTSERGGNSEWRAVPIADGRPLVDRLLLHGAGFELRAHDSAVSSFYDDDDVRTIDYQNLFTWNDDNGPAAELEDRIASIDITGTIATLRLELENWTGFRFTDLFTLLKVDSNWKIMNKVFHVHA